MQRHGKRREPAFSIQRCLYSLRSLPQELRVALAFTLPCAFIDACKALVHAIADICTLLFKTHALASHFNIDIGRVV